MKEELRWVLFPGGGNENWVRFTSGKKDHDFEGERTEDPEETERRKGVEICEPTMWQGTWIFSTVNFKDSHFNIKSQQRERPVFAMYNNEVFCTFKMLTSQVWWYTPFIPALGRLRQENHEFKTSLGHIVRY
jgi:hypothetical protein